MDPFQAALDIKTIKKPVHMPEDTMLNQPKQPNTLSSWSMETVVGAAWSVCGKVRVQDDLTIDPSHTPPQCASS